MAYIPETVRLTLSFRKECYFVPRNANGPIICRHLKIPIILKFLAAPEHTAEKNVKMVSGNDVIECKNRLGQRLTR